jgi:hypothetical protein
MYLLQNNNFITLENPENHLLPGSMIDKKFESPSSVLIVISHLIFNDEAYISVEKEEDVNIRKEIYAQDT